MDLKQAYEGWAADNANHTLYTRTRTAFRKTWWLIPTNKPCNYYTLDVLGRAFQQANGSHDDKAKAASVMVHILNWAHENDPRHCGTPLFAFQDIINYPDGGKGAEGAELTEGTEGAEVKVTVKPEALEARRKELAAREQAAKESTTKKSTTKESTTKESGRPYKHIGEVAQLDPDTLKVIRIYKSGFAAQKELQIRNVNRAVERCGLSAGYYWCRVEDVDNFKPNEHKKKTAEGAELTESAETAAVVEPVETQGPQEKKSAEVKVTVNTEALEARRKELAEILAAKRRVRLGEVVLSSEQAKQLGLKIVAAKPSGEAAPLGPSTLRQAQGPQEEKTAENLTNDELIGELRRRGWKGKVSYSVTIEL